MAVVKGEVMTAAVPGQEMSVLGHAITNAMSEGKPEAIPARIGIGDACFMDLTPIAQDGSRLQQSDLVSKINVRVCDASTSVVHVCDCQRYREMQTCKMTREMGRTNQEFPAKREREAERKRTKYPPVVSRLVSSRASIHPDTMSCHCEA